MAITKVTSEVLDLTDAYAFTGAITGAGGPTLGTEQATTSGTGPTFGSIPAGTKIIFVTFVGVSMSGTDELSILLGDAGGLESSGYTACAITTIHNTASAGDDASGRFVLAAAQGASDVVDGVVIQSDCVGGVIEGVNPDDRVCGF